jgi:predicted Zn-dependent peptidase
MEKITLDNGTRVVFEHLPHVRSAAFGVWVGTGSRHETPALAGASHALEHMAFKGTLTRSSQEIAQHMDSIGGRLNAFTTKEFTCYYGRALDTHLTEALDLVFDIFFNAKLDESDWQTERGVILEEIGMYADTPDDLVSERLFKSVFKGSPLARPILGTPKCLADMSAADLKAYRDSEYRPSETVFSVAGCFTDKHIEYITERLSVPSKPKRNPEHQVLYTPSRVTKKKPIEQNHWCLAYKGLHIGHEDRYSMQIMSGILGDGMSSRLFRAVREDAGLCYEISSFTTAHRDIGLTGVYMALGRENEEKALSMVRDIVDDFAAHGPAPDEVERTRQQIKSSMVMSLESTQARMNHMGQSQLLLGYTLSQDEIIDRYDTVTRESVRALAQRLLTPEMLSFSAVGRVGKPEEYKHA